MYFDDKLIKVDLQPISTPKDRCHVLFLGPIEPERLRYAEECRFDQLPVLDEHGNLCGLVATETARRLFDNGEELDRDHQEIVLNEIEVEIELFDLLSALEQHRAAVFLDRPDGVTEQNWFSLVTLSDLNRHPFRAYLYPLFARLESALAELIQQIHEDPWEWLKWTPLHTTPTIIGRWELDKRDNIETTPLNGCELRDLMAIAKGSRPLQRMLRYDGEQIRELGESLPNLRNDIMHPVRALVHSKKTVGQLRKTLAALVDFTAAVEVALQRYQQTVDETTGWHPLMIDRLYRSMEIAHRLAPSGWSLHADKGNPMAAKLTIGHRRAIRMGRDLNELLIDRAALHQGQVERLGSVTFVRYPDAGELEDPYLVQIPTEDLESVLKMLRKDHERVVSKVAEGATAQDMEKGIFTNELADHLRRVTGQVPPTPSYIKTGD